MSVNSTKVLKLNRLDLQLKRRKKIKVTYPEKCDTKNTIKHNLAER